MVVVFTTVIFSLSLWKIGKESDKFAKEIYIEFVRNNLVVSSAIDDITSQKNEILENPRLVIQVKRLVDQNYTYSNGAVGNYLGFSKELSEFAVYTYDQITYFHQRVLTKTLTEEDIKDLEGLNNQIKDFTSGIGQSYLNNYKNMSIKSIIRDLQMRVKPIYNKGYNGFYNKNAFDK